MENSLSISYEAFARGVMGEEGAATSSLLSSPKDHTPILVECSTLLQCQERFGKEAHDHTHIVECSTWFHCLHASHIEKKNGKLRMERLLDFVSPPCHDATIQEGRENEISILLEESHLDSSHKVPNESEESAPKVKEEIPQEIGKRRKAKKSKAFPKQDKDCKFLCKGCHRPFSSKQYAKLHELTHKKWEELKGGTVYHEKCGECNKIFFTKQNYQIHIEMHIGTKRFRCHRCDKGFTQQVNLIRHSYVHLTEEEKEKVREGWKNNCYFCSKRFSKPSLLIIHMVTHTKERPFKCMTCTKTFTTNGSLTYHNRCHSEEARPLFKCNTCAKSFTTNGYLSIHTSSVHLKEFHSCLYCPKTCSTKCNLQAHMKKKHPN